MPTLDDLFAELTQVTTMTRSEWEHVASLPPELQRLAFANFASQDWTDPATSAGQRVLAVVAALGGIGSAVGSVAGAIAGVKGIA